MCHEQWALTVTKLLRFFVLIKVMNEYQVARFLWLAVYQNVVNNNDN